MNFREGPSSIQHLFRSGLNLLVLFLLQTVQAQTYKPGELTVTQNGLQLSTGLSSRVIAEKGIQVNLDIGGTSTDAFHTFPDGAAVIPNPDGSGEYVYISNSEADGPNGGVGGIYFNALNQVTDYKMLLTGTDESCSGGVTWWDTYLSLEEGDDGQIWEVDPWGSLGSRKTIAGNIREKITGFWHHMLVKLHFGHWPKYRIVGAEFESAAYDRRNPNDPKFYFTIDSNMGPLMRFTPDAQVLADANASNDYTNLLHAGANTKTEFLLVDTATNTFTWTEHYGAAKNNAAATYVGLEGLEFKDGILYVVSDTLQRVYVLNIDAQAFTFYSTISGEFQEKPDQIHFLPGTNDLYFCEDGVLSSALAGLFVRDPTNEKFYTVLQAVSADLAGENSGIAFSPDRQKMFVSYLTAGKVFEITRTDGLGFHEAKLPPVYHT